MYCNTCKTTLAARVRIGIDSQTGEKWEVCDICSNTPPVWLPDVFLGGPGGTPQTDDTLCDPKTGKNIPFSTKREKAVIMNMLKVRQSDSAEHQHGSRNETKRKTYFT